MKILITGGRGFIGSYLKNPLVAEGHTLLDIEYDVLDLQNHPVKTDVVIHLASKTDREAFLQNPETGYKVNIMGTVNVLEFCRRNNARLIFFSTCGVYAEKNGKVKEEDRLQPKNAYVMSKFIGEQLCRQYWSDFGVSVVILRLFNVYGYGQKPPFLVPYMFECLFHNKKIELKTPYSRRDFIYIEDVCSAIIQSVSSQAEGMKVFNIGSGKTVSVINLAKKMHKVCNRTFSWSVEDTKKETLPYICADISKSGKELLWTPKISLDDGLKRMWRSYNDRE